MAWLQHCRFMTDPLLPEIARGASRFPLETERFAGSRRNN
jgi:hypothetical protein